ncbi:MAG: hypothetical protein CL833_15960 [Crocinitomicaceae bacterium]|nr:hypothetical protein [Crocinitomicaceae bacterium]
MAPRTNIYQEYEDILSNRGLGSMPANNKSRLQLGIESGRLRDPSSIPERPGTGIDELQRGLINLGNILKSGGLSQAYQPPKNIGEATQQVKTSGDVDTTDSSLNIFQVPGEVQDASVDVLSPDKPSDSVLAQSMAGKTGAGYKGRGEMVEKPGERADALAQAEMAEAAETAGETALVQGIGEDIKKKGGVDAFANTFQQAMEQFGLNVRGTTQPSQSKTMDDYKKEFAEATGIDISGKVDKSHALMSLGLALMQNRAGKGFNVGRILNAVGEAGQAALPALAAAKQEAKQNRIAAGQYALQQIKSDEDARAAIRASDLAFKRELFLKDLDFKRDRQKMIDEAILAGNETKLTEALKNTEQKTIRVGAKEVKIGMGQDLEFGGRTVFSSPEFDARQVADAYKKTGEGLDILRKMEGLLLQLKDQGEGNLGGTALQGALEGVISVGNAMGMNLKYPSGDDVAITQQLEVLQRQVLSRFKKFIAQETGNGISNVDVQDIKAALGQFQTFEDIDKAIMSVGEMQELFLSSQNTLDPIVDMFMDRKSYRGNEVGTQDYEKVIKLFSEKFGNISVFEPTIVEGPDGQTIMDYDIRTGA